MSDAIESCIRQLLSYIGDNPEREGLIETPHRVAKAWKEWGAGYRIDVPGLFKEFKDGAAGCDQMVVVRNVPFVSHCEHHLAMFIGTATVAYIPSGRIVGLSKLVRVVDAFARRLQVQERMTNQIADAIDENLHPLGVGVRITATHSCISSRGACKHGSETVTSALRGAILEEPSARAEFLELARGA